MRFVETQNPADCIQTLSPEGTSLVIAPSHRMMTMMTDIPMANVSALLDAFRGL